MAMRMVKVAPFGWALTAPERQSAGGAPGLGLFETCFLEGNQNCPVLERGLDDARGCYRKPRLRAVATNRPTYR
jgi:hypothetical protein